VDGQRLDGILPAEEVEALVQRTVNGGAEVVSLLKTGSAFYAPGASVARMVHSIVTDAQEELPVCVYLNGKYGVKDTYMTVPATIGAKGVLGVEELPLNDAETEALHASAASIGEAVDSLGIRG
jgi:malate dehydrogenase